MNTEARWMNLKDCLMSAVDYAIKSNNGAWYIQQNLIDRIQKCENICLYGAGKFLRDICTTGCLKTFFKNNIKYICDCDEKKHGMTIEIDEQDVKVITFEELKKMKDPIVIVTLGRPDEVQNMLSENQIENYSLLDLARNAYTPYYTKEYFIENKMKIEQVFDLLADQKSKVIYTEAICYCIAPHLVQKTFTQMQEDGEYFSTDIFDIVPEEECIVDCGAFTGDSLVDYMKKYQNKIGKYYCFELSDKVADVCQKVIAQYHNDNIELIRAGVSNKTETIEIDDVGETMANTTESSGGMKTKAKLVKLDDELKNKKVTYIKMDIEGEEIHALEGAKTIIQVQKPKLAISAYHLLSDMWEIPLLIHSYCEDYQIYFRHHSPVLWDTDCYAVVR